MEGPHALPEPPDAGGLLGRCGRHPAQPLAGVCSSCLMERLSSVGSPAHPEIVELTPAAPRDPDAEGSGSGAADQQGKLRKTLMLLFQMDDSHHSPSTTTATTHPPESKNPQPSHPDPSASRGAKWKGGGAWLRSILPKRGPRRRTKEEEPPRPSVEGSASVAADPGAGGDATPPRVERRASFRRSCEWMVCRDPPSASRGEPPRHSWDGSMVGRALACSFACLDEPADGVTRVRHSNADEPSSLSENPAGAAAESRNVANSADVGQSFRERTCGGDAGPEMSVSGVVRRRSNRWSRVWDRSITSPLKEFVRKGEHALDRSLSESRKETRRCKNGDTTAIDGEVQPGRNGLVSARASQNVTRSNGDAQNLRANRLKSKESKIGRSRSVHYTSPGNFDNGMLRFYLTPMRSNRTANRGRRRSSRLFSRGLFGFV